MAFRDVARVMLCVGSVGLMSSTCWARAVHHQPPRQPWIKEGHSVYQVKNLPDGLHAQPPGDVQIASLKDKKAARNMLFIPAGDVVGMAAFWAGDELIVVGDHPYLPWGAIGRDGTSFDKHDVIELNDATVLRISLPKQSSVRLSKTAGGWILSMLPKGQNKDICWAVKPEKQHDATLFPFSFLGHIVTLWNPSTGSRVYVATVRQPQCVNFLQRNVGYDITPAILGSVVQDYDGRIIERMSTRGPLLQMVNADDVWSGEDQVADSAFQGSNNNQAALASLFIQKWHKDEAFLRKVRESASRQQKLLPRKRNRRRSKVVEPHVSIPSSLIVHVAQSALWAGNPERTWDVLQAYNLNNPSELLVRQRSLLLAYAAILTGRDKDAYLLSDPLLGLEPNMAVWHAFFLMRTGYDSGVTSAFLKASFPTFLQFPVPLRHLMMPQIAGYLALFGDQDMQDKLLKMLPFTADYDFTHAVLYLKRGEKDKAFDLLKQMAASPNSFRTASARSLLTYLFMNDGLIPPLNAAQEEEKLLHGDMGGNRRTDFAFDDFSDVTSLIEDYDIRALLQAHETCRALELLRMQMPSNFMPEDRLDQLWKALLKQLIFASAGQSVGGFQPSKICISTPENRYLTLAQNMHYLEDTPENAKLLEGYAHFLIKNNHQADAIPVLLKLEFLTQNPYNRVDTVDKLVTIALKTDSLETASDALQRAHIPGLAEDSAYQLKYNEAALAVERGDDEGALLLLGDDRSSDAMRMKGRIYEERGDWKKAIETLYSLARQTMGPATSYMEPSQHELVHRIISDVTHLQDYEPPPDLLRWNQLPVRSQ